ncbi:hypothetical protein RJ639_034485 [Escallonia herrerae]|uniref:non-specific serine/threonine protein kinase n=1 Tax=Escallonia herrerae TaxID=1293975 RepID=A0AA88X7U1_9ASTE|nr:hypothetical protein RJ639_034485 [Escallonia herrerae]
MKFPFCFCSNSDTTLVKNSSHGGQPVQNFRVYSRIELKDASNGFHSKNKVGEGGFGSVYKVIFVFARGEHNRIRFSWAQRRDVTLGVAHGLAYLHEEVDPHIVHRDIKASNILLDQDFAPKVSDFGLSKLFRDDISHISTRVAGTLDFWLSKDFLEINIHVGLRNLLYAWEMYNANNLLQLVDPVLNGDFPTEEAFRFARVGLLCVQEKTKLRPPLSIAIKMLTNEIDTVNVTISQPGHIADLMDVKIGHRSNSNSFFG